MCLVRERSTTASKDDYPRTIARMWLRVSAAKQRFGED